SPCARKRSTQIGASAAIVASCAAEAECLSEVPPVTQPPQEKPTIMAATAATNAPWIQGLVLAGIFMARVLSGALCGGSARLSQPSQPEELLADGLRGLLSYWRS